MGNHICGLDEEKKQSLQPESKIVLEMVINKVTIQIVQADIVEEKSDVIGKLIYDQVNASHQPNDSYIAKRDRNPKLRDIQMSIGELVITEACNVNCCEIYHIKLPLYQEPRDLLRIFNSYRSCLTTDQHHKIISFTTEQNTPNFTVPKQYIAEVMLRAFITFISENVVQFEVIKFVSLDHLTLKYFAYELTKQADELKIPELNNLRYQSFLTFISTDDQKEEEYQLSEGLTTEHDG